MKTQSGGGRLGFYLYFDIRHTRTAELSALGAGRTLPQRCSFLLQVKWTPTDIEGGQKEYVI